MLRDANFETCAGARALRRALLGTSAIIAVGLASASPVYADCTPPVFFGVDDEGDPILIDPIDPGDTITCTGISTAGVSTSVSNLIIDIEEGASVTDSSRAIDLFGDNYTINNRGSLTGLDSSAINVEGSNLTFNNWGTLASPLWHGIQILTLGDGTPTVINNLGATISVAQDAIFVAAPRINILNFGTLVGGAGGDGSGINVQGLIAGTIENQGTITANERAISIDSSNNVTVVNRAGGTITSTGNNGIRATGDNFVLENHGTITGAARGVQLEGNNQTVNNHGTIIGQGIAGGGGGIHFREVIAGSVDNFGLITASSVGVDLDRTQNVTITNHVGGVISVTDAGAQTAVRMGFNVDDAFKSDNLTFINNGRVESLADGVTILSPNSSVTNTGKITAVNRGVVIEDTATNTTITNAAGGTIEGGNFSILGGAGNENVTNAGSLIGNVDLGAGDDSFTHDFTTGSVSGTVDGGGGTDTFGIMGTGTFAFPDWAVNFEAMEVGVGTEFVIEPAGDALDLDLSLSVLGTVTHALGTLNLADFDSKITIKNGGTYDLQSGGISSAPGVAPNLVNSGTFKKTGGSDSLIEAYFENKADGTINILAGTATFVGPNILAGTMTISDGARAEFFGSELPTHLNNLTVTGQGVAWFSDEIFVDVGTTSTFNLTSDNGKLVIANGTTIGGTGTLEIAGNLEFSGAAELRTRLNVTDGRVTQIGDLTLRGADAKITVQDTAQYWLRGNSSLLNGPIDNAGLFLDGSLFKAGADTTSTIEIDVTHLGDVVSVDAGATLSITGTQTFAAGKTFFVGEGILLVGTMVFAGGTLISEMTGEGHLTVAAGLDLGSVKMVNKGNIDWLAGAITGGSVDGLVVTNGLRNDVAGKLTVMLPVPLQDGLIDNFGTLNIDQTLTMDGGLILNQEGGSILLSALGNISSPDGSLSLIENYRGLVKKTGGLTSQISVGYTSDGGTTRVAAGTLQFNEVVNFKGSSHIVVSDSATLVLGGPEVNISGPLNVTGAGVLVLNSPLISLDDTLTNKGTVRWLGGTIEGSSGGLLNNENDLIITGETPHNLNAVISGGLVTVNSSITTSDGTGAFELNTMLIDAPGKTITIGVPTTNGSEFEIAANTTAILSDVGVSGFGTDAPGHLNLILGIWGLSEGIWEVHDGASLTLNGTLGSFSNQPDIVRLREHTSVILHGSGKITNFPQPDTLTDPAFSVRGILELRDGAVWNANALVINPGGQLIVDKTSSVVHDGTILSLAVPGISKPAGFVAESNSNVRIDGTLTVGVFEEGEIDPEVIALFFDKIVISEFANLSGTGTINGHLIQGGNFSPGNSPGTFTINGVYTQTSTGILQIEIGGTVPGIEYDQLIVNGTATFEPGSTIEITLLDLDGDGTLFEPHTGDVFDFLVADELVLPAGADLGDLITFTNLPAGLQFEFGLTTLNGISMFQLLALFGIDEGLLATFNPQGQLLGGYVNTVLLDNLGSVATDDILSDLAILPDAQIPTALAQISPEAYGSLALAAISQANAVTDSVGNRYMRWHDPRTRKGISLWAAGLGVRSSRDGDALIGTSASDTDLYGVTAGIDVLLSGGILLGAMAGTAKGDQTFDGLSATNDSDGVFVGGYAAFSAGPLGLGVMAYHSFGDSTTERSMALLGTSARGEGDFNHTIFSADLFYRTGKPGGWSATPIVRATYIRVNQGALAETGSPGLAYDIQATDSEFLLLDTAVRLAGSYDTAAGTRLIPEVTLGYRQELLKEPHNIQARFVGASGAQLTMPGADFGDGQVMLGAGLTARFAGGIDLFARYSGELGTFASSHRVTAGAQITF